LNEKQDFGSDRHSNDGQQEDQKLIVQVISAAGVIDPSDAFGIYVKMRVLEADSTVQPLEACTSASSELYW
jgi:hypothetical protein